MSQEGRMVRSTKRQLNYKLRINGWIQSHLRAWELAMAGLALLSVGIGIAASQLGEPEALVSIEWILTAVFAGEYVLRLWSAPNRSTYFKTSLIDLISILPPVRGARLLRLLRLLRVASDVNKALGTTELSARALTISRIAIMWAAVVAVSALGMYLAESGENPNVRDIWDALWWAVVTITTVGYGDVSPTTAEGRLAAAVLMVLGITFFSFLTATFTAALTSTSTSETVNLEARMKTLKRLRTKKLISAKEYESTKRRYLAQ